jgi:hypothetical protein
MVKMDMPPNRRRRTASEPRSEPRGSTDLDAYRLPGQAFRTEAERCGSREAVSRRVNPACSAFPVLTTHDVCHTIDLIAALPNQSDNVSSAEADSSCVNNNASRCLGLEHAT